MEQTQKSNTVATGSNTIATGFAMFSMFFGAGNLVFPLALGQYAQSQNIYAILGLLISAVGVPFMGLIAMTLFNGDYRKFFDRIGTIPGFLLSASILGLIGPFGAIPRCITLSYSTLNIYFSDLSLVIFSLCACALIFLLTVRRTRVVDIVGYVLTPVLLLSLFVIIVKGFLIAPSAPISNHVPLDIFFKGLLEGYQTMDLLGAFFFSSVVLACLERDVDIKQEHNFKRAIFLALKASAIGAGLLALTYFGFSYLSAKFSAELQGVTQDKLVGNISALVLGHYAAIFSCLLVVMATLTTAIALSAVFAEFLHRDLSFNKISYPISLIITLIISFFVSTLDFTGIVKILFPILQVCYPALIVLTIVNILFKLYHFKPVKIPVFIAFILSLLSVVLY